MTKPFQERTYKRLQERLDIIKAGGSLEWTRLRNLFYKLRNQHIRATRDTTLGYTGPGNFYTYWTESVVNRWCKNNAYELGFSRLLWFRFRDEIRISAKPKAVCEGVAEKFLLDLDTRDRVVKDCSLILVCEKDTVSEELMERLMDEGYKINVVSTGGFGTGNVSEVMAQIEEHIDTVRTPNFYVLMLHDFDLSGLQILVSLKEIYSGIIDVGVNSEFVSRLRRLPGFRMDLIEEDVVMSKKMDVARKYMQQSVDYTMADYKYLQGKSAIITGKKGKLQTQWTGKRIEIDAIHAEYGIDPFVDYVLEKIEKECKVWDLKRIGVDDFELEEPDSHYDEVLEDLYQNARDSYEEKHDEIEKHKNNIQEIVDDILGTLDPGFKSLLSTYWGKDWMPRYGMEDFDLDIDEINSLKEDYESQMNRTWSDKLEYQDKLGKVNDKLEFYNDDVREGEEDLQKRVDTIQKQLDKDKKNDQDLVGFKDELGDIDWGKSELDVIEPPDERDLIKRLIEKLQGKLRDLDNP